MSLDWFGIETEGLVGIVPLDVSLRGCLNGTQPSYCQNIVRDAEGSDTAISSTGWIHQRVPTSMWPKATFSGIDIQGTYDSSTSAGSGRCGGVEWHVYLDETSTIPLAGELEYDCAGLYGNTCGSALPDWRHSLRLTWKFPVPVQASLQWRYVSSVTNEQNTDDQTLSGPAVTFGGTLDSRNYFDLSGNWNINETYHGARGHQQHPRQGSAAG